MSASTELMMKKPSLKIKGISQSDYTIEGVLAALRNFICARFKENELPHLTRAAGEKFLIDRSQAFTILSVLERQPSAHVTFAMSQANYHNPHELMLSSYRLPDEYYPVLIHAINEELTLMVARQTLGKTDADLKFYQDRIENMLTFLRAIGVDVGDDYVRNLWLDGV